MVLCTIHAYRCQSELAVSCAVLVFRLGWKLVVQYSVGISVGSVSSKYYVVCYCQAAHKLLLCGAAGAGNDLAGRALGGRALVSASQVLPLASLWCTLLC